MPKTRATHRFRTPGAAAAWLLCAAHSSCGGRPASSLQPQGRPPLAPCEYAASTESIFTFGAVQAGKSAVRAFEVRNLGDSVCVLASLGPCPEADEALSMDSHGPLEIEPGSTLAIPFTFSPTELKEYYLCIEADFKNPNTPAIFIESSPS